MALHASSISPKSPALNGAGEEAQKKRDKEMKDMVSALTHRLVQLQAANKHDHPDHDDDDKRGGGGGGGRSIITLTGDNTGATMRFLLPSGDHRKGHKVQDGVDVVGVDVGEEGEEEGERQVYTNSNFQGFNNSIMLNGSYSAKDPGVHMVVSDDNGRRSKKKFRGKKKDHKGTSTDSDITTSDSD